MDSFLGIALLGLLIMGAAGSIAAGIAKLLEWLEE